MSHWENKGFKKEASDERYTPKYVFDAIGEEFYMDVAAPVDRRYCHVPAGEFITSGSLEKQWAGFVWMNPPFGKRNSISLWLDKIYTHKFGIALTPDRTSAPWWQKAAKECNGILFVSPKIEFIWPDGSIGTSPSSGTTLLAYGTRAVNALRRAEVNGLGFYLNSKI